MTRWAWIFLAASLTGASSGCAMCQSCFDFEYPAVGGCGGWHADDHCRAGSAFCNNGGGGEVYFEGQPDSPVEEVVAEPTPMQSEPPSTQQQPPAAEQLPTLPLPTEPEALPPAIDLTPPTDLNDLDLSSRRRTAPLQTPAR